MDIIAQSGRLESGFQLTDDILHRRLSIAALQDVGCGRVQFYHAFRVQQHPGILGFFELKPVAVGDSWYVS